MSYMDGLEFFGINRVGNAHAEDFPAYGLPTSKKSRPMASTNAPVSRVSSATLRSF